jgi:hypothetical protein
MYHIAINRRRRIQAWLAQGANASAVWSYTNDDTPVLPQVAWLWLVVVILRQERIAKFAKVLPELLGLRMSAVARRPKMSCAAQLNAHVLAEVSLVNVFERAFVEQHLDEEGVNLCEVEEESALGFRVPVSRWCDY